MNTIEIGTMFTLISIASIVSYIPGGILTDKIGSVNALTLPLAANIFLLMLLPFLNKWPFIVIYTLSAFIFMMHEAPELNFIVERTSKEYRATATSIFVMLLMPFSLPSPMLGALLWKTYSPQTTFVVLAPALLAVILFRTLIKSSEIREHA